jgi:hypothetical protein
VQDDNLPAVINRAAEDHGCEPKLRREGEGGHATEAIATASNALVLVVLVLTLLPGVVILLPGVIMMMVRWGRLLGGGQMEPSMCVAADERQRE